MLPTTLYLGVFAALIGLTAVTVAVALIDLGPFNLPIALVVAALKGSLVCAFFMHLWFDSKLNMVFFVVTLLFLAIFIIYTLSDVLTRDEIDATRRNYLPRDETVQQYLEKNPGAEPLRPGLKDPKDLAGKLIEQEGGAH